MQRTLSGGVPYGAGCYPLPKRRNAARCTFDKGKTKKQGLAGRVLTPKALGTHTNENLKSMKNLTHIAHNARNGRSKKIFS